MTKTTPAPSGTTTSAAALKHPPDTVREYVESIAMAVILALVFRNFVAEAFVIPTGSMAPTLTGRHKDVECPQCKHWYQTGASNEAQQDGSPTRKHVIGTTCPMCRYTQVLDVPRKPNDGSFSGDRIIVSKFAFDFKDPQRWDVIVFKYPGNARDNYIKRLVGLPNETLRIAGGNVYTKTNDAAEYQICRKPPDKLNVLLQLVHDTDFPAKDLIKYHWPSLWYEPAATDESPAQWQAANDGKQYTLKGDKELRWLRYRHMMPDNVDWLDLELDHKLPPDMPGRTPGLITDMYAYNAGFAMFTGKESLQREDYRPELPISEQRAHDFHRDALGLHWVDDIAVQGDVKIEGAQGEVALELVRGGNRYQCSIDVATGLATLKIVQPTGGSVPFRDAEGKTTAEPTAQTAVRGGGKYTLRLSNVDHEVLLWVNGSVVKFNGPTTYDSPELIKPYWTPTDSGDTAPAAIGGKGITLAVERLQIYRDKYYIATSHEVGSSEFSDDYQGPLSSSNAAEIAKILDTPQLWETTSLFASRRAVEFVIPADCFFPMGDNSPYSKDARLWAEPFRKSPVPPYEDHPLTSYVRRDLLVGKALMVYLPHFWNEPYMWPSFRRWGWIK